MSTQSNIDVVRIVKIQDALRDDDVVSLGELDDWLATEDPNVIGATVHYFERLARRNEWPLPVSRTLDLLQANFAKSLIHSFERSRYAFSPYEAAHALVSFLSHRVFESQDQELIEKAQTFLRDRFLSGNEEEMDCVVNGVLEHLFEKPKIRELFSAWEGDPSLKSAYDRACRWGIQHEED